MWQAVTNTEESILWPLVYMQIIILSRRSVQHSPCRVDSLDAASMQGVLRKLSSSIGVDVHVE